MKVILFIFLPFIIFNIDLRYSITVFIDYLQNTGYYELIENIKHILGDDIAIEFCKDILGSKECEEAVRVYMSADTSSKKYAPIVKEELKNILIKLLFQDENLKILSQFFTKKDIIDIITRIIDKSPKIINIRTDIIERFKNSIIL